MKKLIFKFIVAANEAIPINRILPEAVVSRIRTVTMDFLVKRYADRVFLENEILPEIATCFQFNTELHFSLEYSTPLVFPALAGYE